MASWYCTTAIAPLPLSSFRVRAGSTERVGAVFTDGVTVTTKESLVLREPSLTVAVTVAVPVCPVATNSGVHWPAHGFLRLPGTIVFEYLEPIPPGLKRAEFMRLLEERIETASMKLLDL